MNSPRYYERLTELLLSQSGRLEMSAGVGAGDLRDTMRMAAAAITSLSSTTGSAEHSPPGCSGCPDLAAAVAARDEAVSGRAQYYLELLSLRKERHGLVRSGTKCVELLAAAVGRAEAAEVRVVEVTRQLDQLQAENDRLRSIGEHCVACIEREANLGGNEVAGSGGEPE